LLPERLRDTPPAEAAALRAGEAASVQPRTAADDPQAAGPWTTQHDPAIALPFRAVGPQQVAAMEAWLWGCYERLDMPTLLLRGAESDLLSPETAQAMTERGPRARWVDLAGVGHAPTLVDPA
ncbi:alpha/beta hydrolase, partial [Escherichia coli]|nr:alpha/beta hydrolase [Escherichia coli]